MTTNDTAASRLMNQLLLFVALSLQAEDDRPINAKSADSAQKIIRQNTLIETLPAGSIEKSLATLRMWYRIWRHIKKFGLTS